MFAGPESDDIWNIAATPDEPEVRLDSGFSSLIGIAEALVPTILWLETFRLITCVKARFWPLGRVGPPP